MTTLLDYIYSMDAAPVDNPMGDGFGVLPLLTGAGTGTSGVVGVSVLPALVGDGHADWATFGTAELPALTGTGTVDGYHPAWGEASLPALAGDGTAHVLIASVGLLPPLFGTGTCGATAKATLPAMTGYALDDSFDAIAHGVGVLPAMVGTAFVCGLDKPLANKATSAAVVNLLQQGNATLVAAAASICAYDDTDDERAMSVVYFVSNLLTYIQDGDGIGDRWTCALATWLRGYGDCEDGAILIHSLLLAAGVNPNRLRTAMGTVLTASLAEGGHAWAMYRRLTDEEWIPLEWTSQPSPYDVEASQVVRQVDLAASYTKISYILTNEAFYAVADASYIPRLAANRAAGAATLPALQGAASCGPRAVGEAVLAAMDGAGLCGAVAAAKLPALAGMGTAQELLTARGEASLAALVGTGATGATAAAVLPKMSGAGRCGTSAGGMAYLPALVGDGTAFVELVGRGAATLPALRGAGRALVGNVVFGAAALPALRGKGRAEQGPMAHGAASLPRLTGAGRAVIVLIGVGEADLPPMIGRGHAVSGSAWAGVLSHDPSRWL